MKEVKVKNSGIVELQHPTSTTEGALFVAEVGKHLPIEIKRFYFVTGFSGELLTRGGHAHKSLEQYIFSLNGSFMLHLDDGENVQDIVMDDPSIGIRLGAKLWHTMSDFSKDAVMLVVANDIYDENDYMRDYSEFLEHIKNL